MSEKMSENKSDLMRKLIDMAVSAGRKRQSPQTGFLHHLYDSQNDEPHLAIPMIENVLFALALFRSRTVENMEEGKALLERLLYFQNACKEPRLGNFPVYLHEFPDCRDRYLGVHLLIPFYWITAHFHHILGNGLKKRFEECVRSLLQYSLAAEADMPAALSLKMGASAKAFGELWGDEALAARGAQSLHNLSENLDSFPWKTPAQLANLLPALELIARDDSRWDAIRAWMEATWHRKLLAYVGPAWSEWQEGSQPQASLYDLYMGYLSGTFPARAFGNQMGDQIFHLQAVLIQPTDEKLPSVIYPRLLPGCLQQETFALAAIDQESEWPPAAARSFHRLHLSWGDLSSDPSADLMKTPKLLHTLVCQGGNVVQSRFSQTHQTAQTVCTQIYTLGTPPPDGEREKCREVAFYLNLEAARQLLVGDLAATTFRLGDAILIRSKELSIKLSFQLLEGMGDFVGHIMRGNRPAQLALKGANRYHAYDWQIFLRTLRRSELCRIQASITIEGNADVAST